MSDAAIRLSIVEKIGYGLGDTASNVIFQTVVAFLAFYYTEVYGLSPAAVGTMFLVVRIIDAVTDPVMGAICDRTHTRWGKFRPYLLWLAVPFSVISIITFTTPDVGDVAKLVYAYVTYSLLMLVYTAINIPYSALGGVMTGDSDERVSVQSWRFVGGMAGGILVTSTMLPLVATLGDGNEAKGYQLAMAVLSGLAVFMFLASFATTRERVSDASEKQTATVLEDLRYLWQNDQWRILALINFVLLIAVVMRGTVTIYYVNYVLLVPELTTPYLTLGMIGGIVGSLIAGKLADGFNLKAIALILGIQVALLILFYLTGTITGRLFVIGLASGITGCAYGALVAWKTDRLTAFTLTFVVAAALHLIIWQVGEFDVHLNFYLVILVSVLNQICVPILWSMMADSVDYGQLKTGRRITGMTFSATLFALKLGVAVGGALAGWLLAYYGYVANESQTLETKRGINNIFMLFPAVLLLLVAYISRYYNLSSERMGEIQSALKISREAPLTA